MFTLFAILSACVPVFRYPGPTRDLGRVEDDEGIWSRPDEREDRAVAVVEPGQSQAVDKPADKPRRRPRGLTGEGVADAAGYYVGKTVMSCAGETYRYDCSGLVNVVHKKAGLDLGKYNSAMMWQLAEKEGVAHTRGTPEAGDVIFFDNTYDRNKNGKLDDEFTHVAVVESVDDEGTCTLVHKGSKGVVRIYMNLNQPGERLGPTGQDYNSWLRARKRGDREGTPYLAGQLYVGHASFWAVPEFYEDGTAEL